MHTHWPEVELQPLPQLKAEEESLLDMHSLLNALNVLNGEIYFLATSLTGDDTGMPEATGACQALIHSLPNRELALSTARNLPLFERRIRECIQDAITQWPSRSQLQEVTESIQNIDSVFHILAVRAREILARSDNPAQWIPIRIEALRSNLFEVFGAIQKNSKGRYRIIYNLAQQEPSDYYVHLDIDAPEGTIEMPLILIDVIRDLMANARKYTSPGGMISAGVNEDANELCIVIQDNGRGIPTEELGTVAQFGFRGSNARDVRTMGAGCGLTKALHVTKRFNGRLWIASAIGEGTRVSIRIPRPPRTGF